MVMDLVLVVEELKLLAVLAVQPVVLMDFQVHLDKAVLAESVVTIQAQVVVAAVIMVVAVLLMELIVHLVAAAAPAT
jgi:hypothetical protein